MALSVPVAVSGVHALSTRSLQTPALLHVPSVHQPIAKHASSREAIVTGAAVSVAAAVIATRFRKIRAKKAPCDNGFVGLVTCKFFGGDEKEVEVPASMVAPPEWSDLESSLDAAATDAEKAQIAEIAEGQGPLSASKTKGSSLRLFGGNKEDVRIKFWRDSAAWCPYCEKVQLALEEEQIPYSITKVNMNCYGNKPMDFLAINPMGMLPVAEVDGRVIADSNQILQIVDSGMGTGNLTKGDEDNIRELLRLERGIFSSWLSWLKANTDYGKRDTFEYDLGNVEACLAATASDGPYFLGAEFSIVECHFAPFLERMAGSLGYFKGFQMRRNPAYPNLEAWFQAMESRDSYRALASDFYTHAHDLPPQLGGCAESGDNQAFKRAIDGSTWNLPLPVDVEPKPWEPLLANTAEEAETARREAARRLIGNRVAVLNFCLRGQGSPGFPGVGAELSDPRAGSSTSAELKKGVDEALRSIVQHLLTAGGASIEKGGVGPLAFKAPRGGYVEDCLVYLRDRIGVPRDMPFPAARQLRAHLNSYIDAFVAAK